MKQMMILLAILMWGAVSYSIAQEVSPKEPRWKQLTQAYGFVIGQEESLELIENTFPDLAQEVKSTRFAFYTSALGESVKGVEEELTSLLGDKWSEAKEKVTSQMLEMSVRQQFTRDQATEFLAEVKRRAKGELPDSIRSALLSAHPRFSANPGLELAEGWKQTFQSKGHPKANGVDIAVSFPASWSKREGNRPNILQFFRSCAGHGPIMCSILVRDLPYPKDYKPNVEDLKETFQPNQLKDTIPVGATFIEAKSIVLEGAPAGMIVSDQTIQRLDYEVTMRTTQFITIHGSSMIIIQFGVAKMPDTTETLDEIHKKYLPTYRVIANTLVLNDIYE